MLGDLIVATVDERRSHVRIECKKSVMNKLPHKTAFVIRFDTTSDIDRGIIEGKVEHVASYKTTRFDSLEELLGFVGQMLSDAKAEEIEH